MFCEKIRIKQQKGLKNWKQLGLTSQQLLHFKGTVKSNKNWEESATNPCMCICYCSRPVIFKRKKQCSVHWTGFMNSEYLIVVYSLPKGYRQLRYQAENSLKNSYHVDGHLLWDFSHSVPSCFLHLSFFYRGNFQSWKLHADGPPFINGITPT